MCRRAPSSGATRLGMRPRPFENLEDFPAKETMLNQAYFMVESIGSSPQGCFACRQFFRDTGGRTSTRLDGKCGALIGPPIPSRWRSLTVGAGVGMLFDDSDPAHNWHTEPLNSPVKQHYHSTPIDVGPLVSFYIGRIAPQLPMFAYASADLVTEDRRCI